MASMLWSSLTLSVLANAMSTQSPGEQSTNYGQQTANVSKAYGYNMPSGILTGQANRIYRDERVLAASASETLVLSSGALLDPFGVAIPFIGIKFLLVSAAATNTNNVVVGGASSHAFVDPFGSTTSTTIVRPGNTVAWLAGASDPTGYPVTSGSSDTIQVANSGSGTTVQYDIIIIGID